MKHSWFFLTLRERVESLDVDIKRLNDEIKQKSSGKNYFFLHKCHREILYFLLQYKIRFPNFESKTGVVHFRPCFFFKVVDIDLKCGTFS